MEFVLHIGLPKTGSMSLQTAFFENREVLRQLGVVYPMTGLDPRKGTKPKHWLMRKALAGQDLGPAGIGMPEDWADRFRSETEGAETCVVSDQHFHRFSKPEIILPLFPRDRTRVVIYLREPVMHVASLYAHSVKIIHDRTMNLQEFARFICWSNAEILDRWIKIFGRENVVIRKYDRDSLRDGDIVADFAHLVRPGLEEVFSSEERISNASLAGNLLFTKRILNHFIEERHNLSIFRELANLTGLDPRFRGRFFVDQETVDLIAKMFRKDCELVEKRFGLHIEPRDGMIEGTASPDLDNLSRDSRLIRSNAKAGGNLAMIMDRSNEIFGS